MEFIKAEKFGHVFKIGLNRPEKMNAFNWQMLNELSEAYTMLDNDPELRCGMLYSTSQNFTSGLDLADVTPHILGGEDLFSNENIDPLRITFHSLFYSVITPLARNYIHFGTTVVGSPEVF